MWHTHDGMGWWMILMGIFWILFWVSIIYLFVVALSRGGSKVERGDGLDALEIAQRRLARGELTPEQFQEIRRHLDDSGGAPRAV